MSFRHSGNGNDSLLQSIKIDLHRHWTTWSTLSTFTTSAAFGWTTRVSGAGSGLGSAGASANEESLKTERLQIERKAFIFALKENPRGRFLRITEDVGGRRDSITVPATGLEEFKRIIDEMARIAAENPAKTQQP